MHGTSFSVALSRARPGRRLILSRSVNRNCPRCKTLRRATKTLSLSRLPPVLLIHLKRFSFKGPFTDKIEKHVDFPLKGLDLTNYMPPPLPPGADRAGHADIPARRSPLADTPVPLRPVWCDEPLR